MEGNTCMSTGTTFTISSTMDMTLFTFAVVAVAVGALDDTSRSLAVVAVPVVAGLSTVKV